MSGAAFNILAFLYAFFKHLVKYPGEDTCAGVTSDRTFIETFFGYINFLLMRSYFLLYKHRSAVVSVVTFTTTLGIF